MKSPLHFSRKVKSSLIVLIISFSAAGQQWNPGHAIGAQTGVYNYTNTQTPSQLVEIHAAAIPNTGLTYLWESSTTPAGTFSSIGTTAAYTFSGPLAQTMYYRRRTTHGTLGSVYSNVIKISVVPANWEDMNYLRVSEVKKTGVLNKMALDALMIGDKLQETKYVDGLGRPIQTVVRESATPETGTLWGDLVSFKKYDAFGMESMVYLSYTTTNQSGSFKSSTETAQAAYYTSKYAETSAFRSIVTEKSPLQRAATLKKPGGSWAASSGNTTVHDLNSISADDVRMFDLDYTEGSAPIYRGQYPDRSLIKKIYRDVNGNSEIIYSNKAGLTVMTKTQVDNSAANGYSGYLTTYFIYDDLGRLRYQLQPEAVKYLAANSWSFSGANGLKVLNEYCFQYSYDSRGRVIWKKSPGASAVRIIYDVRDRAVLTQDGGQAAKTPAQWTGTLYDDLDRPTLSFLYHTNKTATTLQSDANGASALYTIAITNVANTGGGSITLVTSYNSISGNDFNNASVVTALKYVFYDNYSFSSVKTFNTSSTNTTAYSTSDANVMSLTTTQRVLGAQTGAKTKVLGSTVFLARTNYYDEWGNAIQTLEDNIKSGVDITTRQYHFDGKVLSVCTDHSTSGTGYTNFKTLTKNIHDKLGRVTSLQKMYGSNAFKTITSYEYDDVGRVKKKRLDPTYTAGGNTELESLDYSFNINGQLTGINKDYALKTTGVYNKWGHFFGLYLGFDNKDNAFTKAELNGQVTGLLWNTQGDDAQRRYNYTYDNSGRITSALFTEQAKPGDGYSAAKMDFSVSGTSGKITYDLNGNLLTMLQKGVLPGTSTPIVVDDLRYTYNLSNKLDKVADMTTATASNGKFGDFKDGGNGTANDYVYDANGNLVVDLNKVIENAAGGGAGTAGVVYNHMDKPELIKVTGKGTIRIVYSADGDILQKAFIPQTGSSTITSTVNEFVYQETSTTLTAVTASPFAGTGLALTSIFFEEGRIRVITPTSTGNGSDALVLSGNMILPNSKQGVYDYYIRDYQENVRMILTEETHTAYNTATMEDARLSVETPIFGQPGAANELTSTRADKPSLWSNNSSLKVSRLGNLAGKNIGPNTLQKVMAGDKISAEVKYYFQGPPGANNSTMLTNMLGSLIGSIEGSGATSSLVKESAASINTTLAGTPGLATAVSPTGNTSAPQAYLTILFFDERFNFISATDGGVSQTQVSATWSTSITPLILPAVKAPKNGYVYVYVSNRSDQHVYFDDFKVSLQAGNIIEENHYYAFGLKIAAISSKKLGNSVEGILKNDYLYNDKELYDEADVNWYEYGFRNYDPQIGRFVQLDPLTDNYPFLTPYQYASNDPITNVDLDGLEGLNAVGAAANALGDFTYAYNAVSAAGLILGPATKAVSTASLISRSLVSVVTSVSKALATGASILSDKITTGIATQQIGNPPGYGSNKKPGGDQTPYFFSAEDAARNWADENRQKGMARAKATEYSSEIRSFVVKTGNTKIKLYYTTPPVSFEDTGDPNTDPVSNSPGMTHKKHGDLKPGHEREGLIHLHWLGSEAKSLGTGDDNRTFSTGDKDVWKFWPKKYFFVLGSTGTLQVKYPEELPLVDQFPDVKAGRSDIPLEKGLYDKGRPAMEIRKVYKQ